MKNSIAKLGRRKNFEFRITTKEEIRTFLKKFRSPTDIRETSRASCCALSNKHLAQSVNQKVYTLLSTPTDINNFAK